MSDEKDQLIYVMDRSTIWKSALALLRESGQDFVARDIVELAEFLAGDNIRDVPGDAAEGDDESESSDSGTEGAE